MAKQWEIKNPATGKNLKTLTEDGQDEIQKKFSELKHGQKAWQETPLEKRLQSIKNFSDLLLEHKEKLATILSEEVGKPLQESKNEVMGAVKKIQFFLNESKKILAEKEVQKDGNTAEIITFGPLGVIVNISAWNYPYLVGINVFIPALIAGNSVLYKPSEFALLTGLEIEKLLHLAGVPQNVFKAVIGSGEVGAKLLDLPIHGVYFTGSYATGKKIAEKVRSKLIPLVMELGGKDPLYVRDDIADIEQVASAVLEGCFYNNGQSCCAVERVYVHEKIYNQFINAIEKAIKKINVGDPFDSKNQQGAITRPMHLSFLEEQVQDALSKGAKLICGGKAIKGPGSFFPPTLLVNVDHSMSIMREESFGPVRGIMKVASDEEAVKLMNDTEYGLTAAIYSKDIKKARSLLDQVNTGTSYINCCDRVSAYLPWSGRGHSGLGTSLSELGLLSFCAPRGIHVRS